MNWSAISAIISSLTLIGVVGIGGVMWGRLTERVTGHNKRLDEHKAQLALHDSHFNILDSEIARLQEWKSGYNAAARISGRTAEV